MFDNLFSRALGCSVFFTAVCGLVFALVIATIAQIASPYRVNGSIIEVDGKKYGSELIGQAEPDADADAIPVDPVGNPGPGPGLQISVAAAGYQVPLLVKETGKSDKGIGSVIGGCTTGRLLGASGGKTVNVLKVNLMPDGILKQGWPSKASRPGPSRLSRAGSPENA